MTENEDIIKLDGIIKTYEIAYNHNQEIGQDKIKPYSVGVYLTVKNKDGGLFHIIEESDFSNIKSGTPETAIMSYAEGMEEVLDEDKKIKVTVKKIENQKSYEVISTIQVFD